MAKNCAKAASRANVPKPPVLKNPVRGQRGGGIIRDNKPTRRVN